MKKNVRIKTSDIVVLLLCIIGVVVTSGGSKAGDEESTRIGVFDSRAVAVAYAHSDFMKEKYKELKKQQQKANENGNSEKAKEIRKRGEQIQKKLHKQGFGTASVSNLLKPVKDKIPEIAEKAGVDVIVSKWDIEYKSSSAEIVDITEKIVKPFNPSKRVLKIISGLSDNQPVSEETLEKMDDSVQK